MESQKLKTQKLKCYVLGPKSQNFQPQKNTRYTVFWDFNFQLYEHFSHELGIQIQGLEFTFAQILFIFLCIEKFCSSFVNQLTNIK